MKAGISRLIIVTAAIAAGTWVAGWVAVPVLALVAGLVMWRPSTVALGASLAWAILLAINAVVGAMGRVASTLGDVMGLPWPAVIVATLLFPALLAWSAAALGGAARSLQATTSRQPS